MSMEQLPRSVLLMLLVCIKRGKRLPLEFLPIPVRFLFLSFTSVCLFLTLFSIAVQFLYPTFTPCFSVTFLLFHLLSFYRSSFLSSVFSLSADLFSSELKLNGKLSKSSTQQLWCLDRFTFL